MKKWAIIFCGLCSAFIFGQEKLEVEVFKDQPVNFGGEKGDTVTIERKQNGRLLFKKVTAPLYEKGTDVKIKMSLKSSGDPWDKSGSVFVITNPEEIDIRDIVNGEGEYPEASGVNQYPGIRKSKNYTPALEILRLMTPFGVGHFSDEVKNPRIRYNRPVYVPKWEEEVVWEQDISHLVKEVTGEFIIGVWLDTWTPEGYSIDISLEYSGRAAVRSKTLALVNTVYYEGQKHPDLFSETALNVDVNLPENAKNVNLYYITTGHGGHSGGDEFIKLNNWVKFNNKTVIDMVPWRDDCASFRRFNPSSGVWTRKDTTYSYNRNREREFKEIEERLASSDLSRSNWCPGSKVEPVKVALGDLKKGNHSLSINIDGTPIEGDKLNHWLVSAYLTYEE